VRPCPCRLRNDREANAKEAVLKFVLEIVGEHLQKDVTLIDLKAGPGHSEASHFLPCLPFLLPEAPPRTEP